MCIIPDFSSGWYRFYNFGLCFVWCAFVMFLVLFDVTRITFVCWIIIFKELLNSVAAMLFSRFWIFFRKNKECAKKDAPNQTWTDNLSFRGGLHWPLCYGRCSVRKIIAHAYFTCSPVWPLPSPKFICVDIKSKQINFEFGQRMLDFESGKAKRLWQHTHKTTWWKSFEFTPLLSLSLCF